ncbi:MAG: restriction endonuclease [Treponema sp.]|nr:restriction endonuclease [Treponema sp.]
MRIAVGGGNVYGLLIQGGLFNKQSIAEQCNLIMMEKQIEVSKMKKELNIDIFVDEGQLEQIKNYPWKWAKINWDDLFVEKNEINNTSGIILITDINEEIKKYFNKNPEKLYNLSSRKFEELIASLLEDMGLDIEITKATRDGGRDIIAQIKNALTSFLIFIECKKYSPNNRIGVNIIRQVAGTHMLRDSSRSIIITTSSYTKDALEEVKLKKNKIELKDYQDIKEWLSKY